MIDLSSTEPIRTLGLYQPYAALMLPPYNKIETRWVREGRKPPFPLGVYLIYATQRYYGLQEFRGLVSWETYDKVNKWRQNDPAFGLLGTALGIGTLVEVRGMKPQDASQCYVDYMYGRTCLVFEGVQRIKPFKFKGKQGVGILKPEERNQIEFL